jgi:lipopolysaccharide biosynthesis protein
MVIAIPSLGYCTRASVRLLPEYVLDFIGRALQPKGSGIVREIVGGVQRRKKKRLCVFAHYDADNLIDDYVVYYLRALHAEGAEIIFCTTAAEITDDQIKRIRELCSLIIVRRNIGYDFASYREGIRAAGDLGSYDELILVNDSVYGPLFDLGPVFRKMSNIDADFWGITDSYEIEPHLQSYFMVFNRAVVASADFRRFWAGFANHTRKKVLIQEGEIGLSRVLLGAGFRMGSSCEYHQVCGDNQDYLERHGQQMRGNRKLNPTLFLWDLLIEKYECPFIKVQLLRDDPIGSLPDSGWGPVLSEISDYDITLIERHLARVSARGKKISLSQLCE